MRSLNRFHFSIPSFKLFLATTFVFGVLSSGPTFAAANDSYYEILKAQYLAANEQIGVNDFDRVGYTATRTCVEVKPSNPNRDYLVNLYWYTHVVDGAGPLLPPYRKDKILFFAAGPTGNPNLDGIETEFGGNFVKTAMADNESYAKMMTVKKLDGYLFFELVEKFISLPPTGDEYAPQSEPPQNSKKPVVTVTTSYGYCYPVKISEE
jgi:hypothetical protein